MQARMRICNRAATSRPSAAWPAPPCPRARARPAPELNKIGDVLKRFVPASATVPIVCCLLALVTDAVAGAQTPRATLRGVIVDQTGARLPGVEIRVLRED